MLAWMFFGLAGVFVLTTVFFIIRNMGKDVHKHPVSFFLGWASGILVVASVIAALVALDHYDDVRQENWVKDCTDRGGEVFKINYERSCLKPGYEVIHFGKS